MAGICLKLDTISEATITDSNDNPSLVEFARHALRQLDNTEIPKAAGLKVNKLRYCLVRSPSMTDPVATAPKPLQTFLVDQLPDESMCKIWTQAREEENVIEVDFAELAAVKTKEARIRIEWLGKLYGENEKAEAQVHKANLELKEAQAKRVATKQKLKVAQDAYREHLHKLCLAESRRVKESEEKRSEAGISPVVSGEQRKVSPTLVEAKAAKRRILDFARDNPPAKRGSRKTKSSAKTEKPSYRGLRFFSTENRRRESAALVEEQAAKRSKF